MRFPARLTNKHIKIQIKALKKTKQEYLDKAHLVSSSDCELCKKSLQIFKDINSKDFEYTKECTYCPWTWITSMRCFNYYKNNLDIKIEDALNSREKHQVYINRRIKQIDNWIKRLEDYIQRT